VKKTLSEERAYWLSWSQIPGVGPVSLKRIQQHLGSLQAAWTASEQVLSEIEGLSKKVISGIVETRSRLNPTQLLETHSQENPQFWTPADADYPRLLLELPSPPPVLYYRGQVQPQENQGITPLVALVGTRYPTEHGRRWTRKISAALAQHGFTVVSGMAAGIDGEAHRACLEAGGRTIAVLGTGVDSVYPANHRQLHEQIQQQGLLLSEYAVGTKPERGNFPARNRIIAGLSRAILVMEAPEKSGSLITARYASEFGRDVYTLPNSPEIEEAKGCLRLIHQGAEIIVHEEELLATLGAIPQLDRGKQLSLLEPISSESRSPLTQSQPAGEKAVLPSLEPHLAKVLQAITSVPTSFDAIVQAAGLETGEVSGALLKLELLGLIAQLPGMRYERL
jgi:DNA processing protein